MADVNPRGTVENLIPSHTENRNAERHGLYGGPR